ncbi:MAG TPA: T9SS type A sorting domain-containing protein [bacterium]
MRTLIVILMFVTEFFSVYTHVSAQPKWRALPDAPRTGSRFDDVFFVNPNEGWIVQGGGGIYRTTDGGATWQLQNTIFAGGLRCIGFANAAKGWLGTLRSGSFLFMTADGGKSWNPVQNVPEPQPLGICGIAVVNDSVVYAAGRYDDAPRVIKTTDGGQNWSTFDMSSHARSLVDCHFFSADSGFAVGAVGPTFEDQRARILFTGDGGQSWVASYTGARSAELCWKISFPTRKVGYVSIEAFHQGAIDFLKTTNGGTSWQAKLLSSTLRDVQGIGFLNEELGWQGGWRSPTYETTDGGETWQLAGFGGNVNRFRFLSDTLAYAVGQTVYKFSNDGTPVTVEEPPALPPAGITLFQNYPNPFNASTRIRYLLERDDEIVMLRVYDLTGRKIKTLFAGGRPPGEYIAEWDGTTDTHQPVASGVYVLRLQAGGFAQSHKMILLR